jgi:1-acyl-sn-glycerol-3-phosphate acyltransferase
MRAIRSLLFLLIFYPATLVFVLVAFAAVPFGKEAVRSVCESWAAFHGLLVRHLVGIRTRIEGELPTGSVLVAGKHQAMFETIELVTMLERPAIVMKRELADIPLFGALTKRYGIIPIDRAGGATALRKMLRAAEEAKSDNRPIVIFPEGTRVEPGEKPPLQSGFAGLYRMLDLPIVPLALDSGRLWPRSWVKSPGTVTFRFGAPIPPGLARAEIEARVHAAINALESSAERKS